MEIIATNALISINETAIVQLVSFLIFLYVMNRIMFRPLLSTISQRKELISDFQKDIISGKEDLVRVGKDLDREQAKTAAHILACRTGRLGGHLGAAGRTTRGAN